MKFAYCGFDFFYNSLTRLLEEGHTLLKLFSFPRCNKRFFNDNVFQIAGSLNVPIQMSEFKSQDMQILADQGCEVIVSAAYLYKIPNYQPAIPYGFNVHPTLLPDGRGPWPLPWTILKEHKTSGVTIHKLTDSWDAGDILIQKSFDLDENENLETLSIKSQLAAADLVSQFFSDPAKYWHSARKQDKGNYWKFPADKVRTLDWNLSVKEILKICRAFGKFESYAFLDGTKLNVTDCSGWIEKHNYAPGKVIHRASKEILIAVKDGFIMLRHFYQTEMHSLYDSYPLQRCLPEK